MNFERVESRHRCFCSQFCEPIAELDLSKMSEFSRCHGSFTICVSQYTAGNVPNNRIYIRAASRSNLGEVLSCFAKELVLLSSFVLRGLRVACIRNTGVVCVSKQYVKRLRYQREQSQNVGTIYC